MAEERMATKGEKVAVDLKLSHPAFGVAEINGIWNVVELAFNPATGNAKVVNTFPQTGRDECNMQFKVKVANARVIT